jgi:hypothetical protein
MAIEEGAQEITKVLNAALQRGEGALIGRNGTIELETLLFRLFGSAPNQSYPSHLTNRLELHAGVWPSTQSSVDKWVFSLLEAIRLSDVLVAGWYEPLKQMERKLLDQVNTLAPQIPLRSLEPYYVPPELRWTQCLAGQRVAVVSSFAKTIESQIQHREEIWPLEPSSLLPETTTWIPIQTGYAPALAKGTAEWPSDVQSWSVAVNSVVKQVLQSKARIALIGCGGLGMLIGAELKKQGVICIVLGGATQVLFGIKGQRWSTHSVISRFWNEAWVWPSHQETPRGANKIEGACYWQGKIEGAPV